MAGWQQFEVGSCVESVKDELLFVAGFTSDVQSGKDCIGVFGYP